MSFPLDMLGAGGPDECRLKHLSDPLPTQHAGGNRFAVVRPFIVKMRNNETTASVDEPLGTITTSGAHHMVCTPMIVDCIGHAGDPKSTYEPLGTQCTHERFAVCTPMIVDAEEVENLDALPVLEDGRRLDIRIRMLKPSELAAVHSFPKDYVMTGNRCDQVKQIGNSVPVRTAEALCEQALRQYA